jgi:uncharacterized membrane protein
LEGKKEVPTMLLLGNALVLVVFLDPPLGLVLFLHDADEAEYLPANAIASAAPAKRYAAGEITSEEYEERRTQN